jgi:hypothetical protein
VIVGLFAAAKEKADIAPHAELDAVVSVAAQSTHCNQPFTATHL